MDGYDIQRYEPGYEFDMDMNGSAVYYEHMVLLISKIKAGHNEEVSDLRDALQAAIGERDALREINEVLAGKLDDMIIVNGQALACSSYVRAEVDALREKVAALRFTCKDVVSNLEAPIVWRDRDSEVAAAILRGALDATA